MDSVTLLLMTITLFIHLNRTTVDAYINAYGLFSDIWAPVVEAFINIGMSVLLGYFFGLHGVLLGVLISLFLVIFCWKPYFLFREGFGLKLWGYMLMYMKHLIVAVVCASIVYYISEYLPIHPENGILSFLLYGGIIIILFMILLMLMLYCIGQGMRSFVRRIVRSI